MDAHVTSRIHLAAIAAVLSALLLLALAGTASAQTTWTLSLSASKTDVTVGDTVRLTATANQSVTGTGNYIDIFDRTTGTPIDFCATGSVCQVDVSQAEAGSHTYIAYVDSDSVFHYPPCCIKATSNTRTVRWHARATAGMDVQFQATGTLPTFPCPAGGCSTTFSGTGSGAGTAHADGGSTEYQATFALPSGSVSGTAAYTEPAEPLCPTIGAAAGTVTLTGSATGVVVKTTSPTTTGSVTSVTFTLNYTYERFGPATAVTITGGTARINFTIPGAGSDYFVSEVTGRGAGAFRVAPEQAISKCFSPGSLPFSVIGDVALVLT